MRIKIPLTVCTQYVDLQLRQTWIWCSGKYNRHSWTPCPCRWDQLDAISTLCGFWSWTVCSSLPSEGESFRKFLVRCGRGSHELPCSLRGPGGTRVLSGRQIAQRHLLHRANDGLQSVLVLGHHDSTPDGDGGGEDGLHDGGVKVHYGLWQVKFFLSLSLFFQLHQVHRLLLLFWWQNYWSAPTALSYSIAAFDPSTWGSPKVQPPKYRVPGNEAMGING